MWSFRSDDFVEDLPDSEQRALWAQPMRLREEEKRDRDG